MVIRGVQEREAVVSVAPVRSRSQGPPNGMNADSVVFKSIMSFVGGYLGVCFIMCHFRLFSGVLLSLSRCSSVSFVWSAVCLQFVMHRVQRWRLSLGISQPYRLVHVLQILPSPLLSTSAHIVFFHMDLVQRWRLSLGISQPYLALMGLVHLLQILPSPLLSTCTFHVASEFGIATAIPCPLGLVHLLGSWCHSHHTSVFFSLDCVDCTLVVYCIYIVRCRCFTSSLFVYSQTSFIRAVWDQGCP